MWRHSWLTKYWYDMADWQHILVYLALGLAVAFLVRKYLLPLRKAKKRGNQPGCGQDDCGCH